MTADRVLPLRGVHNFRDYGGYALPGGGRLRRGELYRSAQHANATPGDLEQIGRLALATVIDLRGLKERSAHPCRRPEGFAAEVLFFEGETSGIPPHLQAGLGHLDAVEIKAAMRDIYRQLPLRESLLSIMRRYFAVLAARDGASLIHCFAGKDRTGIAVALFHHAVGVARDDIMDDYLLTNTAGDPEARVAEAAPSLRARYGTMKEEAMRMLMSVQPEYLEAAFEAMAEAGGTIDGFLESALGVDSQVRAALRDRFAEA